jgi:CheY-like chemotaxis protein
MLSQRLVLNGRQKHYPILSVKCFHSEQFSKAQTFFEIVLQMNENDKVAQIYLTHCQNILSMIMPQSPSILIVDDMPLNIQVLSKILSENSFKVLIAESGESALQIVKYESPHLILLDVIMPGIDGFETCRRLKAEPQTRDIPVIFITALTEIEHKINGFKVGAVDYLTKPFQYEEILIRVKAHLELVHLQNVCKFKNSINISNLKLKAKIERLIVQGVT